MLKSHQHCGKHRDDRELHNKSRQEKLCGRQELDFGWHDHRELYCPSSLQSIIKKLQDVNIKEVMPFFIRSFSEDLRLGVLVADGAMHDAVRTEERS